MIIARKLLVPTLAIFLLILLALGLFFAIDYSSRVQVQAQRDLDSLEQALQTDLRSRAALASALAAGAASNPELQAAFAAGDRQRLLDLTLPIYRALSGVYQFSTQQFISRPATVFLRLEQPARHDDDLSALRPGLLEANAAGKAISGIEIGPDGLSLRGINPVFFQGRPAGAAEVGLRLGQNLIDDLKAQHGGEWHLLLRNQALRDAGAARLAANPQTRANPVLAQTDLSLQASTMDEPVFAPSEAYRQALAGEPGFSTVQVSSGPAGDQKTFAVRSLPLRDLNGAVIGIVDIWTDQSQAIDGFALRLFAGMGIAAAGMLVGALLLVWTTRRLLSPIQNLSAAAAAVAQGDLQRRAPLPAVETHNYASLRLFRRFQIEDEVEGLTISFNQMADQIETLVTDLEARVFARTRQLERRSQQLQAAGEVAAAVASAAAAGSQLQLESLLSEAVEMIRQRFDFYFAGIYLLDERGEYAMLKAATGLVGRQLLQENYRLRVGQVGMIGAAAGSGRARVAMEVNQDSLYHYNPLLPETRSEAVLPMRLGPAIIGVMDVQSQAPDAFQGEDITLLQTMADQLAIAISNARLIQELNISVADLEQAHGELAQQAWQAHRRRRLHGQVAPLGYTARNGQLTTVPGAAPPTPPAPIPIQPRALDSQPRALDSQPGVLDSQPGVLDSQPGALDSQPGALDSGRGEEGGGAELNLPIQIRGQTIGAVQVRFADPQGSGGASSSGSASSSGGAPQNGPSEIVSSLVEEVTGRLGLVLESARLLSEAQRLADREQQINWIAAQIRGATTLDAILQNTARSLGQALNANRTLIQISTTDSGPGSPAQLTPPAQPTPPAPLPEGRGGGNGDSASQETT